MADEPTERERAERDRIRGAATGMSHHEAAEALEAAEEALAAPEDEEVARAAVAEWERITELLADHSGPYAPESDPFVQGQLTARENLHTVGASRAASD
ncbi:hypothetical protein ACFXA3_19665 [Streptomyces sp. NPDC059456]|uniref:hypothetical protein n=1 Tax=Streptomyces sp. NPDC059456 TaxID=3346838 RepID=UPI0036BF36FD